MPSREPVLAVQNLSVSYGSNGRSLPALRDVSLQIERGQVYGLVGESGSGKTTLALAIMRYLPADGTVVGGRIRFMGDDLLTLNDRRMQRILGSELVFVPQDPHASLNPSMRLGEQVAEVIGRHRRIPPQEARARVLELFERVRLSDPERVAGSYPHEISGGMKQRILLAMAISLKPALMILDEPTTSLDVTTEAAILDLLRDLIRERDTAIMYVSHNLGVVSEICQRVSVLYAGEIAEDSSTVDLYRKPLHPYSRGLLDSVPRPGANKRALKLRPIEGRIPALDALPGGCTFRPRCPLAVDICLVEPPLFKPTPDRRTRCHRWQEIDEARVNAHQPEPSRADAMVEPSPDESALSLIGLQVHFPPAETFLQKLITGGGEAIRAVDRISFDISRGETLGLVGESGSGKTTAARAILGLSPRTGGDVKLYDRSLPTELAAREAETLRKLQIVFQEPDEALNPYLTIGEALRRPMMRLSGITKSEAQQRIAELLKSVNLSADFSKRLPGQLSGGEKQRAAIARAFASNPELLIADEPVSSLDVSVQASVLNVIHALQQESGSSALFISHDLVVVGFLSDRVAVIYLGRLMEVASAEELFDPPYHPYTEALLSAIPLLDPEADQEQIRLEGELPSLTDYPTGCPFHTRCPRFLGEVCVQEEPPWRVSETGRWIYCHIPLDELQSAQKRAFRLNQPRGGSPA